MTLKFTTHYLQIYVWNGEQEKDMVEKICLIFAEKIHDGTNWIQILLEEVLRDQLTTDK